MDKRIEAIKRMEKLGLMRKVIDDFKNGGDLSVYYSERISDYSPATLYWIDNNIKYKELVNEFEKKTDSVVYHCILSHTNFGDLFDMLFVSKYEEEWEMENEDINDGIVFSNCVNLTDNNLSDMDSISVRAIMGGLERIG